MARVAAAAGRGRVGPETPPGLNDCIFCSAHLGSNGIIEHFPVGHIPAFDSAKRRLGVVCHRCARWVAVEEAEGLVRHSRLRVQIENIDLARTRDDTRLVRIGDIGDIAPGDIVSTSGSPTGRRVGRRSTILPDSGAPLTRRTSFSAAPIDGRIRCMLEHPNVGCTASIPTSSFDFDIIPDDGHRDRSPRGELAGAQ